MAINLGDAVLRFLGDTTALDKVYGQIPAKTKSSVDAAGKSFTSLDRLVAQTADTIGRMSNRTVDAATRLKELSQAGVDINKTNASVSSVTSGLRALGLNAKASKVELQAAEKEYERLVAQVRTATTAQQQFGAAASAAGQQVNSLGFNLGRGLTSVKDFAAGLLTSLARLKDLGIALLIFKGAQTLKEGASAALEFGAAFAEVTSIMDNRTPQGVAQIKQLHDEILNLNPALGDATELTKGLYEAISSGVEPAQAVRFVGESAIFAKAALTDTFTAVNVMTSILNAYGKEASEANHVSAALFETIVLGKTRGPELAGSLGRVIPVAASLKVNLNEVLAAVATLTLAGLDTDEAMTALRGSLVAILSPTSEAEKMAKQLGFSLRDMRDELRTKGLAAVLGEMAEKTRGSAEATSALFGNVRALNGVLTLTGAQASRYKEILGQITEASDKGVASQEAMQEILKSQQSQLDILQNTIKNQFTKAWEEAKPIVDATIVSMKQLLLDSGALKVGVAALAFVIGGFVAIWQSLLLVANLVGAAMFGLAAGIIKLAGHFPILKKYVNDTTDSYKALKDGQQRFMDSATEAATLLDGMNKSFEKLILGNKEAASALNATTAATWNLNAADKATLASLQAHAAAAIKNAEAHKSSLPALEAAYKAAQAYQAALIRLGAPEPLIRKAAEAVQLLNQMIGEAKQQATEAQKAVEAYAKAHGITFVSELKRAYDEAQRFYLLMVRTEAPFHDQQAALENLQRAFTAYDTALHQTTSTLDKFLESQRKAAGSITITTPIGADSITTPLQQVAEEVNKIYDQLGIRGAQYWMDAVDLAQAGVSKLVELNRKHLVSDGDVLQAMMRSTELQIELHKALGESYDEEEKRLEALRKGYDRFTGTTDKLTRSSQRWADFWKKDGKKTSREMKSVSDIGKDAFFDMIDAIGSAIVQAELYGTSIGEAMRKATAAVLASISAQAAIQALYNLAIGFAALARHDYPAAHDAFKAAAIFGIVSVSSGIAASLLSGTGSSNDGSHSAGEPIETTGAAGQPEQAPVQRTNVQRFAAGALISGPTLAMVGDAASKHSSKGATEIIAPLDDPDTMSRFAAAIAPFMQAGGDTYNVGGFISADTMRKVMRKMSKRVEKNGTPLKSSVSLRNVKRS